MIGAGPSQEQKGRLWKVIKAINRSRGEAASESKAKEVLIRFDEERTVRQED